MINEIQSMVDDYLKWLKDKTKLRQVNEYVEITAPYMDRHNDYLQIYVKSKNNEYRLTDDGYIIDDLTSSGCNLDSPKRQELLKTTLNGFGVQLNGNSLEVIASKENFASRKHCLIQAMLAINDLFFLAAPVVTSLFLEDVVAWFDSNDIRYTPKVKFTGKSGYDHLFDFVIPKSRKQPERILRAINQPTRDNAQAIAFAWFDTKEVRPPDSRSYALLNDTEHAIPLPVIEALKRYDINPVIWSKRNFFKEELVN